MADRDHFYVDLNASRFTWLYHDPDSPSGDEFVENVFLKRLLEEAVRDYGKEGAAAVFECIESNCRQYVYDKGTQAFRTAERDFNKTPIAEGLTESTIERFFTVLRAKDLINKYCLDEFGERADFSDLRRIGLAYTTITDKEYEVQVYANLMDCRIDTYLGRSWLTSEEFSSLEAMTERLATLDFSELTSIPGWIMDEYEMSVSKEDLAVRLTFFLKDFDYYGYMDTLEVGETDADAVARNRRSLDSPTEISEIISQLSLMIHEEQLQGAELYKCYDLMTDLHKLYNQELVPVYDREIDVLDRMCDVLSISMDIGIDNDGLWIKDDDGTFHEQNAYKHMAERYLTPKDVRSLRDIDFGAYADTKELFEHNDVRIGTRLRENKERNDAR